MRIFYVQLSIENSGINIDFNFACQSQNQAIENINKILLNHCSNKYSGKMEWKIIPTDLIGHALE